jgi:hypothetical protein
MWTVSFGWHYDFKGGVLTKTEDMPDVRPSRPCGKPGEESLRYSITFRNVVEGAA